MSDVSPPQKKKKTLNDWNRSLICVMEISKYENLKCFITS